VYIQRGAMILPDSSQVIRFQVNPTKKGRFTYQIPVYTSDKNDPTYIELTGYLKELPERRDNSFTDCPNFNQRPGDGNPLDFQLTVVTIDKDTREPLAKSQVKLIQNGRRVGVWQTNKQGKIQEKVPLGLSYFQAQHDGYIPAELGSYINFQRNYIVLELEKVDLPEPQIPSLVEPDEERIVEAPETSPIPPESPKREILLDVAEDRAVAEEETSLIMRIQELFRRNSRDVDTTPVLSLDYPDFASLDPETFDADNFRPVNVVFIIDVSYSMKQADRLELMKYALLQLTNMLRPQDQIALVSYSTDARILLPSVSGREKEKIEEEVSSIRAFGSTAGGAGIKLGYKVARKNLIKDGTNHVIIITDGAFNVASGDYKKEIRKHLTRGITFSVVTVKSSERDLDNLQEAADIGRGRLVPVNQLSDAEENLRQEIRLSAFRGKK
jgi:Ca-activated chloride channel homolog